MNAPLPFRTSLLALVLASGTYSASAAEDLLIDDFTDPLAAAATERWWGNAIQTYEHDATQDAQGNPQSGALKVTVEYDIAAHGGENQFSAWRILPGNPVDGSQYETLEFDLKYDASSVTQGSHYGNLEIGVTHTDFTNFYFGTIQVPAGDNEWRRISVPVNQLDAKVNMLRNFHFKKWSGGAGDGMTGTQVFWIDNVTLVALPDNTPPPPPPAVSLDPAIPGLNLISSGGGQYSRQTVRTAIPEYSWVDAAAFPVTYSLTISDYPAEANYQTVIYLVPGDGVGAGVSDPDWNRAIVALAYINNDAQGGGFMRFAYKNDVPGSNGPAASNYWTDQNPDDLFDGIEGPGAVGTAKGGTITTVGSSTIFGKWSVTFTSNTDVTLTAPDGNTSSGSFANEATAQLFSGPLYAYFGTVPQSVPNMGKSAVFSHVSISGLPNPIDENFSVLPLNPLLEKSAADVAGVVPVSVETPFWLGWSLPAVGFVPQQSPALGVGDVDFWTDLPAADAHTANGVRRILLNTSEMNEPGRNFFRLAKP